MSQKNKDDIIIYANAVETLILVHGAEWQLVSHDDLIWNEPEPIPEAEPWLTLKDISEQLTESGCDGTYYVLVESALSGAMYQYGNYPEIPHWIDHGETKGYA